MIVEVNPRQRKIMVNRAKHMLRLFFREKYYRLGMNMDTVYRQRVLARKNFGVRTVYYSKSSN